MPEGVQVLGIVSTRSDGKVRAQTSSEQEQSVANAYEAETRFADKKRADT